MKQLWYAAGNNAWHDAQLNGLGKSFQTYLHAFICIRIDFLHSISFSLVTYWINNRPQSHCIYCCWCWIVLRCLLGRNIREKKQKLIKLQRINIFGVCNYRQNFQSTFYWIFYSLVLDFVGQPNEVYCR